MSDEIETQMIHTGDVREVLPELPESSVHMCMTSPPYFGLRDYGDDEQIGLEESLDEYISELVDVGDALRRVLRDDGSWWLNLGDSYAGSGRGAWDKDEQKESWAFNGGKAPERDTNLKRKNKMLVPHRVAIALQEAGWVVRNDVTWVKPNPMPQSVKDRLNTTTEQIFHLTPQPDYWYDLDAIREPHAEDSKRLSKTGDHVYRENGPGQHSMNPEDRAHPAGKNPGDVFEVTTKPFPDAHFAVYPPKLCEKPIKASCPPKVCVDCGTPYDRETEQVPIWEQSRENIDRPQARRALELADEHGLTDAHFEAARDVGIGNLDPSEGNPYHRVDEETAALAKEAANALDSYYREALLTESRPTDNWQQTCDCDADDTDPGIVLDPFAGAGTTCLKAKELGRRFIGIELNPEYADMARARVGLDVDDPSRIRDDAEQRGLEVFE